jgi:hypothetical protein
LILRNHGAQRTCLHGVQFFGVDMTLQKWFSEQGMTQYYENFVKAGFNQVAVSTLFAETKERKKKKG